MSQRPTVDTATLKTRSIVYQNPDGTFPEIGGVLAMGDYTGHAAWTHNPYLDSITLTDGGLLTYDGTDLLLNGVPVCGGVMNISGGTNISVTGPASTPTVNLDIQSTVNFNGQDINDVNIVNVDSSVIVGSYTTAQSSVNLLTDSSSGLATFRILDGTNTSGLDYATNTQNLRLFTDTRILFDAKQTIASQIIAGPTLRALTVLSNDGSFQIGAATSVTDPSLVFQGPSSESIISAALDSSASLLVIDSSSGTVGLQIAVPLHDVTTGTAGMAGQVLTSQGAGQPPVWSAGGILGRYWTSVSGEITIDSTVFPLLAGATGAVRMRVDIMGGGGGGGGGANGADGSGGGGGQGFNKTGIITHTIGAPVYISIGVGGAGGIGGTNIDPSTDGADGGPTFLKTSITGRTLMPIAGGGGGGRGPNPTNVGGDGFVSGEDGSSGASPGGNGGGYYGGASEQNGGIGGDTTSGTGCGGGGGGSSFGNPGGDGGTGDCGYCLIEILEVV